MNQRTTKTTTVLMGLTMVGMTGLTGCPEPSREFQRDRAVFAYCVRLDECGRFGGEDDDLYTDYDDCEVDQRNNFNDIWPADECSDGRMNESKVDVCVGELEAAPCDANFLDVLEFLGDCGADEVCVDPAN